MLYLHCGWPRTSTTSLQTALFVHREELAVAGVLFPERWLTKKTPTHHGLSELLRDSRETPDPFDRFRVFLDVNSGRDVIFSAEAITTWLLSGERQDVLLRFLAAAREAVEVRCIWTLRRFDDAIRSLYLRRLVLGLDLLPPEQHFNRIHDLNEFFSGMLRVQDAVDGNVVYVRYESGGGHNDDLLAAFGIPPAARVKIREQLLYGSRLNASVGHKAAVALLNLDELSTKIGAQLDGVALRKALQLGDFEFDGDRTCVLVSGAVRRHLHEQALAGAHNQRFLPYDDFFGDAEIPDSAPVDMVSDALTDEDLQRLARFSDARIELDPTV